MYLEKQTLRFQSVDPISTSKASHGVKYPKQFHRNLRLVSKESKAIYKPRSARSSLTSLKKKSSVNRKSSLQNIVKSACHYSTCQNVKFDSGINNRHTLQSSSIRNDANIINRRNSVVASIGERPRSYAEMIADYSKVLNMKSSTRSDNLYFTNGIRKSPFSTVSTPPLTKVSRVVKRNKISNKQLNNNSILSADARKSFDFRHHDMNKNIDQDCVATKNDDRSYAKLIADCSKHMHNMSLSNVTNNGLMLKSNVLSRNSRKSFATPTRNASSTNVQEPSSVSRPVITSEETDDYWTKEIQNVTNDLNAAVKRKTAKSEKSHKARENDIPESDFIKLQDRITKLSEIIEARKQKDTTVREANLQDRNSLHEKMSDLPPCFSKAATSSSTPTSTSATTSSSKVKKDFTHVPSGGNTGALKQPQMKLRMVPSEKESLVFINVDSSSGLSDPLDPANKQLSVVVQSDQQRDPQSTENQWTHTPTLQQQSIKSASQRNDFGPMRISISENSAPIKQIEFSINGKPVSELKSITARTEKLDVVSSMDKIEIRIPFAKDDGANAPSNVREESVFAKETDLSDGQILNVQISANFQNQVTKSRIGQTTEKVNTIPPSSLNTSKINYAFKTDETMTNPSSSREKQIPKDEKKEMKTTKNTVHSPETKQDDTLESDSRFPSKMIPWWSSSDSFKKMKKKDGDTLSKKKKTSLNLKLPQNLTTKLEKSEEMPNSKSFVSKIQSTNNANSNPIFSPRSTEYLLESKPVSYYYSSSFRVKPNQENSVIISNAKKRILQAEDNLVAKEDNKNNFEIEQTEPITDTNQRVSRKEKESILQRRHKTLNTAENFSLRENREKKRQYSLKRTLSIEDVPNTRAGIKNIQNIVKSTEKRQDTWLGYSKLWAKSIERLNNEKLISNKPAEKEKTKKTPQVEQNVIITTADIKMQNRINVNDVPHIRKDDALNSPNSRSFSNVKQTMLMKQEKLAADIIVPRDKFKLQTSKTLSESSKMNSIIETSSKAVENSAKSRNKVASANELFSSRKQTNASSISKNEKSVTKIPTSAKHELNKTTDMTDKIDNVVSQNPKHRYLLSKSEKHSLRAKSKKNRRNVSRSVSFPRKLTSTITSGLLSSRSKMQIESMVTSKDNCTYATRSSFIELLHPNFDRKDNTSLNSQPIIFDFTQNPKNVRNISDHNASNATGLRTDKPEKYMLYSAWLQQLRKNKNEKLL